MFKYMKKKKETKQIKNIENEKETSKKHRELPN